MMATMVTAHLSHNQYFHMTTKIARNDPCPCGSGKKYKQCCLASHDQNTTSARTEASDAAKAMQIAIAHHEAGRLLEADATCKQILETSPNYPDALHLQGMIAYQVGMLDVAEVLLNSAVEFDPKNADAHHNLGIVLMAQDKPEEAQKHFQKTVALQPRHGSGHFSLGNAYKAQDKLDEAIGSYQKAVSLTPEHAQLHNNLGDAFQTQGKLKEAIACYRKALKINPGLAEVHYNLGDALLEQYKRDEAIACYLQAIKLRPDYAEAYNNLAKALKAQNKTDEAIAYYRKAIAINPNLAEAYHNLGDTFFAKGRLDEAIALNKQALALKPDFAKACISVASANIEPNRLDPNRLDEAEEYAKKALSLDPELEGVWTCMGNIFQAQGKLEEAISCYQRAHSGQKDSGKKPDNLAYSNMLFTMQYLNTVRPEEAFHEHQRFAERYETPLKAHWQPHSNSRDPERKLKIGYVSADFFNHAVAFFIEPILASHDKSKFEVHCYYNRSRYDAHTERIKSFADHWTPCVHLNDDELADRIRADGIDILVDLSGHTGLNRLLVFARKPAPVQATWIGYAGSTGLTAMDYRLTNAEVDPPGLTERYHSETLIRMPNTGVVYRPDPCCPPVNTLPALTSREFIFASLNNLIKINRSVIALWGRILQALPHAKLMLGNVSDEGTQQRVVEQFSKAGVTADRLMLIPRMSFNDYLTLHHQIDLALDPFPYNGGTTTMHSLWMGVPVLTMAGRHTVSRCAVPLLSRAGLNDFITHNEEEYFQNAIKMAQDLPNLNRVRQSIRERMSMKNCDPLTITRDLEDAYREIWRKWCIT